MITEQICTKEVCLLMEKIMGGTKVDNVGYYSIDGSLHTWNEINFDGECQAFTQSVAMRYLREMHNISVFPGSYTHTMGQVVTHSYGAAIIDLTTHELMTNECFYSSSFEESTEQALKYVLNKMNKSYG